MKFRFLSLAIGLSVLTSVTAFAAPVPVDLQQACGRGGTRVVSGTFDAETGAVDLKVTLTDCAGRPGDKPHATGLLGQPPIRKPFEAGQATHNGTVTVKGTFLLDTTGTVTVDLLDQIDTSVTFDASANTMTRVCTITRVGTLDAHKHLFKGTVTHNNCTMTGNYHENFGLIEHLLRNLTDTSGL